MLVFLDKVTEWVDNGDAVDVVSLGLAKAFDKVPHQRLLLKLSSLGTGGKLFEWTRHWLSDRMQRVCINGVTSKRILVLSEVPRTGFGPGTATVLDF